MVGEALKRNTVIDECGSGTLKLLVQVIEFGFTRGSDTRTASHSSFYMWTDKTTRSCVA